MEGFDPLGVGIHRASTITFPDAAAYAARGERGPQGYSYGLYGTPTTRTLEAKITRLHHAARTLLAPSGQAANALGVLPFVSAGDQILIGDNVYPPMRDFALSDLTRLGVEVQFFDPTDATDLANRIGSRTRIVWCESPGSTTMELADLPALARLVHEAGALFGIDNTWATPLNLKPLTLGADFVTEALTKFVSGHSDVLLGSISFADDALAEKARGLMGRFGVGTSPDDAALVLRGFETLGVRMAHSNAVALRLMDRLGAHPLVARILHPALLADPGHALWKRDFLGSSGVFSVVLRPEALPRVPEALDRLKVFAIGASWGGTRSLVAPMPVSRNRSATKWLEPDLVLRFSVGLEAEEDLQADLRNFLDGLEVATG
jgi:cystathionine beta-lyase